MSEENTEPNSK